ncbi:hypothetical protein KGP36_07940 [Patescibacteria group bacterium]|nr:hypothetical protein [Patescibacteria group bacterium]
MKTTMNNPKIFAISGGFYYFGDMVESPQDGYLALKSAAMFGGFSGGKGLPGLARGDKAMTVNLDRFPEDELQLFPETACFGILSSVNLYDFKGTTCR